MLSLTFSLAFPLSPSVCLCLCRSLSLSVSLWFSLSLLLPILAFLLSLPPSFFWWPLLPEVVLVADGDGRKVDDVDVLDLNVDVRFVLEVHRDALADLTNEEGDGCSQEDAP